MRVVPARRDAGVVAAGNVGAQVVANHDRSRPIGFTECIECQVEDCCPRFRCTHLGRNGDDLEVFLDTQTADTSPLDLAQSVCDQRKRGNVG